MHTWTRGAMAWLLVTMGCLLAVAPPSSGAVSRFYGQGGEMRIGLEDDPADEIVVEFGGSDHPCADPESPNWIDLDVQATTITVVDGLIGDQVGDGPERVGVTYLDLHGGTYQLDLTVVDPAVMGSGSAVGFINGAPPDQFLTQAIPLLGQVWEREGCERGDQEMCMFLAKINLTSPYDGSADSIGPLNGSASIDTAFCLPPYDLRNTTSGLKDLTFTLAPPG